MIGCGNPRSLPLQPLAGNPSAKLSPRPGKLVPNGTPNWPISPDNSRGLLAVAECPRIAATAEILRRRYQHLPRRKASPPVPVASAGTGPNAPSAGPSLSSSGISWPAPKPGSPTSAPAGTHATATATVRSAPTSASSGPSASTSPSPRQPPNTSTTQPQPRPRRPQRAGPLNHARVRWRILTVTHRFDHRDIVI
jgi:hypothetical protein